MDMPGKEELQKTYEDLADEVLIEIARDLNQEYEDAAVKTARVVLDSRGVNIPDEIEESVESLNRSGEALPGPLLEIPKFSAEEASAIEDIFIENNIAYERHPVAGSSCSSCRCDESAFHVQEAAFNSAIELLKKFFMSGADEESLSYFSGECPACGTKLSNVEKCTDCGLTLAVDYAESLENHPFIKFLKRSKLIS